MVGKIVALITDFGYKSPFVGIMKGVIKTTAPESEIIDITHNISEYSIQEAAFVLAHSYSYFPKNTVFVTVVDPGVGSNRKIVLLKTEKYYFIAPDNGILSWTIKKEKVKKIISVTNNKYFFQPVSNTFHGRDIFAPIAGHIINGIDINNFGPEISKIYKISFPEIIKINNVFQGQVLYIDKFGNVITNFTEDKFRQVLKNGLFELRIKNKKLDRIQTSYSGIEPSKPCLIWGSFGYLEIALREDSIARLYRINVEDKIIIRMK